MPFTFQAKKVVISITYDCFTLYETGHPKLTHDVMVKVQQGCQQILKPVTVTEPSPTECVTDIQKDPRFDRFVYRIEPDHDFYHQDPFNRNSAHCHVKLFKPVNIDIIEQLAEVLDKNNIFDQAEEQTFRDQWLMRNDAAFTDFESQLTYDKSHDINQIIKHVKTVNDVDTLLALQRHLLKHKFDYLRDLTGKVKISFWRGTDSDAKVVTTSKTWAMIEKAFSLQLANNMYHHFHTHPYTVRKRAIQLITNHAFFALKRLAIPGQNPSAPNASIEAFENCDISKFTDKYTHHFNKYR